MGDVVTVQQQQQPKAAIPRARSRLELLSNTASVIEKNSSDEDPTEKSSVPSLLSSVSLDKQIRSPKRSHSFDDSVAFLTDQGSFGLHASPTSLGKAIDSTVFSQQFSLPHFPSNHHTEFYPPRTKLQPKQSPPPNNPVAVSVSNNSNMGPTAPSSGSLKTEGTISTTTKADAAVSHSGSFFPSWAGVTRQENTSPVGLPMEDIVRENLELKQALAGRDVTIQALQKRIEELEERLQSGGGIPTRKISQIPIPEMMRLMGEYGSEVSEVAMAPRKDHIKAASVIRQFRRWNPHFFDYFQYVKGSWQPKLGRDGEQARRLETRREAARKKEKKEEAL